MSHKRGIGKQCRPRSDAADRGVWSGSTLFASSTGIFIKHGSNKTTDTHFLGNAPVQGMKVEESTRRKWVKYLIDRSSIFERKRNSSYIEREIIFTTMHREVRWSYFIWGTENINAIAIVLDWTNINQNILIFFLISNIKSYQEKTKENLCYWYS